jgi:hypothetical protein
MTGNTGQASQRRPTWSRESLAKFATSDLGQQANFPSRARSEMGLEPKANLSTVNVASAGERPAVGLGPAAPPARLRRDRRQATPSVPPAAHRRFPPCSARPSAAAQARCSLHHRSGGLGLRPRRAAERLSPSFVSSPGTMTSTAAKPCSRVRAKAPTPLAHPVWPTGRVTGGISACNPCPKEADMADDGDGWHVHLLTGDHVNKGHVRLLTGDHVNKGQGNG